MIYFGQIYARPSHAFRIGIRYVPLRYRFNFHRFLCGSFFPLRRILSLTLKKPSVLFQRRKAVTTSAVPLRLHFWQVSLI